MINTKLQTGYNDHYTALLWTYSFLMRYFCLTPHITLLIDYKQNLLNARTITLKYSRSYVSRSLKQLR
jgi:hypothetical protein